MAKQPVRPKFFWDGGYLSELETRLGDECIFLCLSPVSFRMLTDMSAMLLWATRYEEGIVPEVGKIAHQELNVPCLTDFYSLLEELNNKEWLEGQFDALGSRMTELEDMDVIVNQTVTSCGCGCDGDTSSTTQTVNNPIIDPNETGITPAYNTAAVVLVDIARCRAANYLARKVISTIRTIGAITDNSGILAIVLVLITAISWLTPWPGDEVVSTTMLALWAGRMIGLFGAVDFMFEYFSDMANMIEGDEEGFVCVLYNWNNSSELGASLSGYMQNMADDLKVQTGMSETTAAIYKNVLADVFGPQLVNWYVDNIERIVPADFIAQYDCLCGATGDSCPTSNIVLAGLGTFPGNDLEGTTQGFASTFNSTTGYYEIIFELAANYCVTIENGQFTPEEMHEVCIDGVMSPSDGSCIRRFAARSQSPFGTAVAFNEINTACECPAYLPPNYQLIDATITGIIGSMPTMHSFVDNVVTASVSTGTVSTSTGEMIVEIDKYAIPSGWLTVGIMLEVMYLNVTEAVANWHTYDPMGLGSDNGEPFSENQISLHFNGNQAPESELQALIDSVDYIRVNTVVVGDYVGTNGWVTESSPMHGSIVLKIKYLIKEL